MKRLVNVQVAIYIIVPESILVKQTEINTNRKTFASNK